jgi:GT2 family glycosyltransferase
MTQSIDKSLSVTAVVVNWNGRELIPICLDSLLQQSHKDLEIIVVDCASQDESVPFIKSSYPRVKVIELKRDPGPPGAINLAARRASGDCLLILNNDVYLPEELVESMVEELRKDENCVLTPVELNWQGQYVHSGIPEYWIGRYLAKIFKTSGESPFYPSTACCMVTRRILLSTSLNESLFMYEDTEWGWRLHLKKIKIKVPPGSFFLHKGAGTKLDCSPRQAYFVGRIALATCFICFRLTTFFLISPLLALGFARHILRYVRRRHFSSIKSYLRGAFNFFFNIRLWNRKRKQVQNQRSIDDLRVLKLMAGSIQFEKRARRAWLEENHSDKACLHHLISEHSTV